MVTVQLKGCHVVKRKLATGEVAEYHYAWRGGPRLEGKPGSAAYIASFSAAHAARKAPVAGTLKDIITRYKASPAYTKLGAHTTRAYAAHLDEIDRRWGTMERAVLEEADVRNHWLAWRDSMSATPRKADMAIGVLKHMLEWAREYVLVSSNQAQPISRLHSVDKSDDIWTAADIALFEARASKELVWALELAICTGLRQGDLIKLAWNHEEDGAFVIRTSKRGRGVTVPITPACRALLKRIERRGPIILTTHRGKTPWTTDGLRASFAAAKAGPLGDDGKPTEKPITRTFHDLRRTACTALLCAGLDDTHVAMIMSWTLANVEAMKRRYVSRKAIIKAVLAKLEKGR